MPAVRQPARRAADRLLGTPSLIYGGLTLLTFPVTEMLVARHDALQYAHDVFDTIVPLNAVVSDNLSRGTASLWSTAITAGNSVLVQGAVPPATPDVWLGLIASPFAAYFVAVALLVWIAGYGMHRFASDSLGLPPIAAYAGGVLYAFSFWHFVYGYSAALLPLLLWSTDRLVRAGPRWQLPAAGVVLLAAITLWWGHLQVIVLVAFAHLAYLATIQWQRTGPLRIVGTWTAIWLVAGILFAPIIVAQLVMLPDSHREAWNLAYLFSGTLAERFEEAQVLYRTVVLGVPISDVSPGSAGYYGTWFMGGIALPLLIVGVTTRRTDRRAWFVLGLLAAIPVIDLAATAVMPHLDGLGILRSFQLIRVRHLLPFALAANVAIGLTVLRRGGLSSAQRTVVMAAVVVVVALLAWQAIVAIDEAAIEDVAHRLGGWWLGVGAMAIGIGGAVIVAVLAMAPGRTRILAIGLVMLVLLLVGERAVYARHERLVHFGLGTWSEHLDVDPARAYIAARLRPEDRTLTAGAHPNATSMAGFNDAAGYSAVYPRGYHALFGTLIDPFLSTHPSLRQYFHEWGNRAYVFGPPVDGDVLDLMGVRWIYAKGMLFDDPSLAAPFASGDVVVYENTDPFPRAYVVGGVREHPDLEALADAIRDSDRDELMGTAHVLEGEVPPQVGSGPAGPAGTAVIEEYAADHVRIRVEADVPSIMVLTDVDAPGWQARVDGEETDVLTANGAFRGVPVPAGASEVELSYRPAAIIAAMVASGVTAIALLGWVLWYVRRHARSGRADEQ